MDQAESKRFRLNVLFGILNSLTSAVQTFWFIPYVKDYMGSTAYGYISVVNGLVNTLLVISTAVASMGTRFILVNLERGNEEEAKKYFNSELVAMIILGIAISLVGLIIVLNLHSVMNVQSRFYRSVQILFLLTLYSFLMQLISSPYSASFFFTSQLYLTYCLYILDYLGRITLTIFLYSSGYRVLWSASLATTIVYSLGFAFYVKYSHRTIPVLREKWQYFNVRHLMDLVKSGTWIAVSSAGNMMLSSLNSYLSNILCGVFITSVYASIMQFNLIESMLLTVLVNSLLPKMFRLFSKEKANDLFDYTIYSMKITALFLSIVSAGIIIYGNTFMGLWMGRRFQGYATLIILTVIHLPFTLPSQVLNQTFTVMNRVKFPALATIGFGVLNLIFAVAFVKLFNLGIYGIALASLTVQVLRDVIFYPFYFLLIIKKLSLKMIIPFIYGVGGLVCALIICKTISLIIVPIGIPKFVLSILLAGGISLGIVLLVLKRMDRPVRG